MLGVLHLRLCRRLLKRAMPKHPLREEWIKWLLSIFVYPLFLTKPPNSWRYAFPHQPLEMFCLNWRKVLGKWFVELWGGKLRCFLLMSESSGREHIAKSLPNYTENRKLINLNPDKSILDHSKCILKLWAFEAWILWAPCKDDEKCCRGGGGVQGRSSWDLPVHFLKCS